MSSNVVVKAVVRAAVLLGITVGQVHADIFDDLEVHGFLTQGYVKTTANSFFGDSESGSFDFRELGVNASFEPMPNLRLSGQMLSRKAGEMSDGSVDVDFAVVDLLIHSNTTSSLGLLAGRVKNPLGFFNETRDVAFTRPGILVPQSVYFEKVRNLLLSSDGVGVEFESFGNYLNLSLYLAAGELQIDENVEYGFLGSGFYGDFDSDGLAYLGRMLLETPNKRLRASFSLANATIGFKRGYSDPVSDGEVEFLYGIVSFQAVSDDLVFTAEYMREPTEWKGFSGTIFNNKEAVAEGYYGQLSWFPHEKFEFLLRYGEVFADRRDRDGEKLSRETFGFVPSHTLFSKIWTAGVSWKISEEFMLRAEYQSHSGTFILSGRENREVGDLEPEWESLALEASYRF